MTEAGSRNSAKALVVKVVRIIRAGSVQRQTATLVITGAIRMGSSGLRRPPVVARAVVMKALPQISHNHSAAGVSTRLRLWNTLPMATMRGSTTIPSNTARRFWGYPA